MNTKIEKFRSCNRLSIYILVSYNMPVVKWKNAGCSEAGLQLMADCAKKVEDKILKHQEEQRLLKGESGVYPPNDPAGYPFHVPTALNDELHPSCIAVAVSHNSGMSINFLSQPIIPSQDSDLVLED